MVKNDQKPYAELYKGAVIILYEKPPGYVRFVSHAVRDLMNGMAAAKKDIKREQTQYPQLVDTLQELWTNHDLPKGVETFSPTDSLVQEPKDLTLPSEIIIHIQKLLRDHAEGRRRSEESPYLFFQEFLPNTTPRDALPEAYPKMWKELRAWFMKRTHESGRVLEQAVIDEIEKQIGTQFEQLETILLSVADRYSNTITTLDEILENANA